MPARKPTYREIEVKLPIDDIPGFLRVLRRLGARGGRRVLERNTLFDTPRSDLRRVGRLLRLREESPAPNAEFRGGDRQTVVTSKALAPLVRARGRVNRYKEKLERELPVPKPGEWKAVMHSLGFRPAFQYEKYRTNFHFRGLHLSLDETPVGTFLELEGPPSAIDRVAHALGFSPRDYMRKTYWDLYSADCRRRGVPPSNMLLRKGKIS